MRLKRQTSFLMHSLLPIQYGEKIISFREPPHCLNVVQFVVYCKQDFFTTTKLWHFVDYFSNTKKSNTTFFFVFYTTYQKQIALEQFFFSLGKKGNCQKLNIWTLPKIELLLEAAARRRLSVFYKSLLIFHLFRVLLP